MGKVENDDIRPDRTLYVYLFNRRQVSAFIRRDRARQIQNRSKELRLSCRWWSQSRRLQGAPTLARLQAKSLTLLMRRSRLTLSCPAAETLALVFLFLQQKMEQYLAGILPGRHRLFL